VAAIDTEAGFRIRRAPEAPKRFFVVTF